jgi:hypothetical protein
MKIGDTTLTFATVDEGRQILTARDDYVRRMSPFDRAARMKTDRDVSEQEYLAFAAGNVLEWGDEEKEKIASAFEGVRAELEELSLPLPEGVLLILTTGNEEGNAFYTRASAIVFPRDRLNSPIETLQKTICHELFHVLSRANPDLREKLYAVIGFEKCGEAVFPEELQPRKITNPDAPRNDHAIRIQVGDEKSWAVPILVSRQEKYDMERGGEFFNYLELKLLLIDRDQQNDSSRLVDMGEVAGFFEQVGGNTQYIIHPEEILADNFALLVMGERDLASPEIVEKMEAVLKKASSND